MYSKKLFVDSLKSQTENKKKQALFRYSPPPAIIFSGSSTSLGLPVVP